MKTPKFFSKSSPQDIIFWIFVAAAISPIIIIACLAIAHNYKKILL